jgi:FlaA1/EpsC-like NDP-sugar epimerase
MKHFAKRMNVLIVGAGRAGDMVSADLMQDPSSPFNVVGFVDDDPLKLFSSVQGLPVLGSLADLREIVIGNDVAELIISIPSERGTVIRRIVDSTIGLGLNYKILPRKAEVLLQDYAGKSRQFIRKVKAEDLLGGEISKSDQEDIMGYARDQVILITGAAGSIGSELTRQAVAYGARKVIAYDWWENGVFDLRNHLLQAYPEADVEFIIGDVKDRRRLNHVFSVHRPTAVFHAAAYKHVPLMEGNPAEAIKNNIFGTKTVAEVAIKYSVSKFVLVSTDKAVNPTNIMGATKRATEMAIHILAGSQSTTTFCAVRFGNVINSNGSAIPIFQEQIEHGGPVTVTHPEVTRFFMTIPEAVHLILQSWIMGENDDLFVLNMGESIRIYELARLLIALNGYIPETEIPIRITGLRPGEKLYEEVLVKEEETSATSVAKIFRTRNYLNFEELNFLHGLTVLREAVEEQGLDCTALKVRLANLVDTYVPSAEQDASSLPSAVAASLEKDAA